MPARPVGCLTFSTEAMAAETKTGDEEMAEMKAHLHAYIATAKDIGPAAREVLGTLVDMAWDLHEAIRMGFGTDRKTASVLTDFATVCERVPDLERRIAALEGRRRDG